MTEPLTGAIALPDGTAVRGRGRRDPMPPGPLPDYGLYLGHDPDLPGGPRLGRRETWRPDWPADWIEWPDFRVPRDPEAAEAAVIACYQRAAGGERVEVACGGGIGRTGTVIACMAVLAGVGSATEALAWTRGHHHRRAVETPGQRRWIAWFADRRTT